MMDDGRVRKVEVLGDKLISLASWAIDPSNLPGAELSGSIVAFHQACQALCEEHRRLARAVRHQDEAQATLTHELRNLLTPLRNALHILRLQGTDPGSAQWVSE